MFAKTGVGVGLSVSGVAGAIGGVAGGKAVEWGVGLAEVGGASRVDGVGAADGVDGVSEPPQANSKARKTDPIDKAMGERALGITVAPRP